MTDAKPTPGPWQVIGTDPAEGGDWWWIKAQPSSVLRGFTKEIGVVNGSQNDPEQQANARLIAEAGTVHHETGLTPRQLAEQRAELLEALELCADSLARADTRTGCCMCGDDMENHSNPMDCGHTPTDAGVYHADGVVSLARAAIAKAKA